jgi:primase-polymerase (primpol)-like protein
MEQSMMNICIFVGICFFAYLIFRNMNNNYLNRDQYNYIEGMTTSTDVSGNQQTTSVSNGVAGNAASYAAQIKSQAIKIEDQLLITKYRTDYENVILNLDELINDLILQTALNVNLTNPQQSMVQLSQLQQAQGALNSAMKYIDSYK